MLTLLILGISIAGANSGQTLACDNCHPISTSIVVRTNPTSTLTVNPSQDFTVGVTYTYSGVSTPGTIEVNWPNASVLNNLLFNPTPRVPISGTATSNFSSSVLTAPASPGLYQVRVFASFGGGVPKGTNFTDLNITVEAPAVTPVLTSIVISPSSAILSVAGIQVFNATAFNGSTPMS
ncbi:MAG: hypothetical protein OIN87_11140, partial [Candidatus Methanoperedens sp.]|nr:hypothetical protein [Candidatus Methanoperedens sp.]